MNAMGFSAKPQSNGDPSFCVKMGKFCEKVPFLGPPQKKEERSHNVLSSNNNLLLLRIRAQNIIYSLY